MGTIILTGIPGVGKSTVMKQASEGLDFTFFNFGDAMFAEAEKTGLVSDRDQMRSLTHQQQKELQTQAAETIGKMHNAIVDTHCTIKTPRGYLPGLPEWIIKKLNPTTIVLVEADPEEIQGRRENDPTRNRDPDSIEEIHEHQMINRYTAMAYASLTGATVKIIQNHDNRIEEAVEAVKPVVQ